MCLAVSDGRRGMQRGNTLYACVGSSRYGQWFVVTVSIFLKEGWDRRSRRRSGLSMIYMTATSVNVGHPCQSVVRYVLVRCFVL